MIFYINHVSLIRYSTIERSISEKYGNEIWSRQPTKKMYSSAEKTDCILWYAETKSPTKVQRMFRTKYGRNAKTPATSQIRMWLGTFKTKHTVSPEKKRRKKVDCERITQCYNANPKQSLRRVANQLNLSCSAVRDTLKKAGYRNYRPQIVQALKEDDLTSRVSFANFILGKVNGEFPNFLQTIFFSDEAVFHLEGGVNKHNSSHWSTSNPHWIVEYSTRILAQGKFVQKDANREKIRTV